MGTILEKIPSKTINVSLKNLVCTSCTAYFNIYDSRDQEAIEELPEAERLAHFTKVNELESKAGKPCGCGNGELKIETNHYDDFINGYTLVKCACGLQIECHQFTNTCNCGKDYNFNGSELAPREQWGYETGESWDECY